MAQRKRILLIEDEADIASMIKLQAELSGYKLHVEVDGINGLRAVEREKPDLVILDIMLPGQNGFDVCRKIKSNPELRGIPLIILSAKNDEIDVLLGLELGADDYIEKPFSPKVLMSRIKAIFRRKRDTEKTAKVFSFGEFTLEVDRYLLRKNDKVIPITLSEFGILKRLLQNRGKVLTRNQLLDDIHNDDSFIVDRNIDVHIASLRRKLGPNFKWIDTVRGIGYRFKLDLSEEVSEAEELVTS
ncbi:MAG: Transcriptional regulatory protein WalR [Chlamydiia bacterium]|nr:Transcriptional regulatory protein WalR [Chlamydiia bacterium]